MRGNDADEAVVGRRVARRRSGLFADRAGHQVGRNRCAGAAARPAGAAAGVIGIAGGAAEGAAIARGVFTHVRLREDDGSRVAQPGDDLGVAGRAVIGIVRRCAAGGAHVEGIELVLDGEDDAVQRPFEPAGARKFLVERLRRFQRVRHSRVGVGSIRLRALAAHVDGDQRVQLTRVLDRLDVAELQGRCRINGAFHAGAVVSLNAL